MLFPVYILLFLSEIISFLHYSTMQKPLLCLQQISINKPPFACNNNQNSHTLFRMKLTIKQYSPQAAIKQVNLYDPCIYDKQLGFNNLAVVIADGLFVDSGICVLTVVCAICATSVQSRVSEQTHCKSPALAQKQALIKNYCFYDQTTHNYSTANSPNKIICILHPFHVQNHNYANR